MSTYSLIFGGVTIAAAIIFSTIIIFRKMGTATSLLAKKDKEIKSTKKSRASLLKSTREKAQVIYNVIFNLFFNYNNCL